MRPTTEAPPRTKPPRSISTLPETKTPSAAVGHTTSASSSTYNPVRPAPVTYNRRPKPVQLIRPVARPATTSFLTGLRNSISPIAGLDPNNYTDSYGPRIHPITGRSGFHTGVDIASPYGTPVLAPANAVVAQLRSNSIYGSNELILAHNRHIETMYGHMSKLAPGITPGAKIKEGQVIGYVGTEGLSTGDHLHWETWRDGSPVNPLTFIGGN